MKCPVCGSKCDLHKAHGRLSSSCKVCTYHLVCSESCDIEAMNSALSAWESSASTLDDLLDGARTSIEVDFVTSMTQTRGEWSLSYSGARCRVLDLFGSFQAASE